MILIADSGSTKTDWAYIPDGGAPSYFNSLGYNPNFISGPEIQSDIRANLPAGFDPLSVKEVYFYGAGVSELDYGFMRETLSGVFPSADTVFVAMDLLAAARALLGDNAGFAAILGTGTNSCLYDGKEVVLNIDSLGFILGDEGSGGYIGKTLLRDYARGHMPSEEYEQVKALVGKNAEEIIEQVYRKPKANRYCAQFCTWVGQNIHTSRYCHDLMADAFRDFFRNIVTLYPDYSKYSLNCVGSVGYCHRELLAEVAAEFGMSLGNIIKSPIEGLVKYHGARP